MLIFRSRVAQTIPFWKVHRAIICAFSTHFNLHICLVISERQRVKGEVTVKAARRRASHSALWHAVFDI